MLPRIAVRELKSHVEETVRVMGWVKRIRKIGSRLMFINLRDYSGEVQLVVSGNSLDNLTAESAVEVCGKVVTAKNQEVEVQVQQLKVLSCADSELPFEVSSAEIKANQATILNYRAFSLRNRQVAAVFKIQSTIVAGFSEYLTKLGFTSIKSPKLVAGATESGASVFSLNYFGQQACLAQSPQFYKQMMVGSGLERVFEIGPVFRAESHNTSRHINEYTSLDLEMGFTTELESLMDLEQGLLNYIFDKLNNERQQELEMLGVYPLYLGEIPRLSLTEARRILRNEYNYIVKAGDIDPKGEKLISNYIEEKYNSKAVFLIEYPQSARPFYTMPHSIEPNLTQSFDLIYRGVEVTTGGLRIHNYQQLWDNAVRSGVDPAEIKYYLEMFKLGMPPHGGMAIGLERLTAQLLNIDNIKMATLFPRDQNRLVP